MAVTIYSYSPIDINAGFKMECRIDNPEDHRMLQEIFVDLCCRCLDMFDLQFGYDENNEPVFTMIYPVKKKFTMMYDKIDNRVIVVE